VLLYQMKLEPIKQAVLNTAIALKGKAPEKFKGNGPELRWGLSLYFEAFLELDTERSHGSGYTRIPWHCIVRYAAYHDLSEDQTELMLIHIQAMDRAYIKQLSDDAEAKKPRSK
jgi:hypothetical protein